VDDAFALDVARILRWFWLAILKESLALRADALGLLTGAPDQLDVTYDTVVAQMSGDGEVVHDFHGRGFIHGCSCAFQFRHSQGYYARQSIFVSNLPETDLSINHKRNPMSVNLFDGIF
jgi:hypothetical protein